MRIRAPPPRHTMEGPAGRHDIIEEAACGTHLGERLRWRALLAADRFTESEAAYRKALELAPQSVAVHSALSLALLGQGRREEALAEAMRESHDTYRLFALAISSIGMVSTCSSNCAAEDPSRMFSNEP